MQTSLGSLDKSMTMPACPGNATQILKWHYSKDKRSTSIQESFGRRSSVVGRWTFVVGRWSLGLDYWPVANWIPPHPHPTHPPVISSKL
ncbi:hypothetical protein M0802_002882 [Mischocyttarus mexicanus]|nr:hypothetical protein M0802_002882 [Mischocyttarus mexicanus]